MEYAAGVNIVPTLTYINIHQHIIVKVSLVINQIIQQHHEGTYLSTGGCPDYSKSFLTAEINVGTSLINSACSFIAYSLL